MPDSKEQNIGQTVYEQLQDMLDNCIGLGRKPWGGSTTLGNVECTGKISFYNYDGYKINDCSYHDLFSKDSGIMEFMEWEAPLHKHIGTEVDLDYYKQHGRLSFHYMVMSIMTAYEKVQYFVNNAIIPQIKSE